MTATKQPTAVIYLRVSTKEQAEKGGDGEGCSIPAQREACVRKAESLGASVISEFVDRGESARSSARPELQRMLAHITDEQTTYVIIHKIDRLARNRMMMSRSTSSSRRVERHSSAAPRASTRHRAAFCCTAS